MVREYTPKRNMWQIERDILQAVFHGTDRTMQLCHRANVRWALFKQLREKLEREGFMVEVIDSGTRRFAITERGRVWITFLEKVEEMAPR